MISAQKWDEEDLVAPSSFIAQQQLITRSLTMNNESEDIKVEAGSWEDLIIRELQRRIRLQSEIQEKPGDEYLLNQLRALDSGFQMMIDKVEVSCLCLPKEWEAALDKWLCEQEM
jgi:hypothetical protein